MPNLIMICNITKKLLQGKISYTLKDMSNNKACGMDGCKAKFFKWKPKDILKFLALILNKVFYDHNTSLFPKHWAISRVVPIYKKGNTHETQ